MLCAALAFPGLLALDARGAGRMELVWPTPNRAWAEHRPLGEILQHAGSGDPESGGWGGVRNGGRRFHEGIDIKCVSRDRAGEPLDDVFAAIDGVVRYINPTAGDSNYGRYIVLEHPDLRPAVYTLYAHLSRIAPGLRTGERVSAGQTIAVMGHSSNGAPIPKARAHLHFEIGLAATRNFGVWYNRQRFGSRNEHGMWNGMNLLGVDPLAFFNAWRARRIDSPLDFLRQQPVAVRVRIATTRTPDFVTRYPALLTATPPLIPAGWEIGCMWTGLPVAWRPLSAAEVKGLPPNQPQIVEADARLLRHERSKSIAISRHGRWTMGKNLETVLEQLFGG